MSSRVLRQVPRINYYEPEEPSWDEYIYCDECGDYVYEYCSIHGDLLVLPDDKVPAKPNFPSYVPRAALTIPHVFLHLAPSIIPGAGLGVYATLTLPRGVRFGPYRGQQTQVIDSMYGWQIYDRNNKPSHVVDAADANRSNWMRYVNCSRHWCEQNLVAYQYQGQLYYRTIKIIPRFTELMVFYGGEFAYRLGVDLDRYNSRLPPVQKLGAPAAKKPKIEQKKSTKEVYSENSIENGKLEVSKPKCSNLNNPISNDNIKINKGKHSEQNNYKSKKSDSNVTVTKYDLTKDQNNCVKSNIKLKEQNVSQQNLNYSSLTKNNAQINIENDVEKLVCDVCKCSNTKGDVIHHSGENKYICKLCNDSFIPKSDRPYKCEHCDKSFKSKSHLNTHINIHTRHILHTCRICEKSFIHKQSLVIHLRIHNNEKPFRCDICNKCFTSKGDLNRHIRVHTLERPHTCNICERRFTRKGNLVTHLRIHSKERPFRCEICNKCFTSKGDLNRHIRVHTHERPHTCNICERRFTRKGHLVTHLRIHTGEAPYACDICDRKFNQLSNMKSHLKVHM